MPVGKDRYGYQAALAGTSPLPPEPLLERVAHVPCVTQAIGNIKKAIIKQRHHGEAQPPAWKVAEQFASDEHTANNLMRVAMYYAMADVNYWVPDPETHKYCNRCKEAKPFDDFPVEDTTNCTACTEARGGRIAKVQRKRKPYTAAEVVAEGNKYPGKRGCTKCRHIKDKEEFGGEYKTCTKCRAKDRAYKQDRRISCE